MSPVYETGEVDPLSKAEQVQALRDARALLTPKTWGKGDYGYQVIAWPEGLHMVLRRVDTRCYCVIGAVAKALDCDPDSVEVQSVVHPMDIALREWLGRESEAADAEFNVISWHDDELTTLGDVHELYDRTLALLESTG